MKYLLLILITFTLACNDAGDPNENNEKRSPRDLQVSDSIRVDSMYVKQ